MMEHLAPLIQTILWIFLIIWIILRFSDPLNSLLGALLRRIDSGSSIKAGPIEIGQFMRPQDETVQRENAREEIKALAKGIEPVNSENHSNLTQRYFLAEDLALRAIQSEYEVIIDRQVIAGGTSIDGAFKKNGDLHVVEVKYSIHKISRAQVLSQIEKLSVSISALKFKNIKIDLVLVTEHKNSILVSENELSGLQNECDYPVTVWSYDLDTLMHRFGADIE